MNKINEEFLHFLWKNQKLAGVSVISYDKKTIRVLDPGTHNMDSGPDFFNARVEIDGTLWAGNVELHINASDWIKHGHKEDAAYDSVILHVVYFNDCEITRENGLTIPSAVIRFPGLLWNSYLELMKNKNRIPCQDSLHLNAPVHIAQWTSALMVQKLIVKSEALKLNMKDLHSHWDAILSRTIFQTFGIPVNTTPFEILALLTPYTLLLRNRDNLFSLESILFGLAGMLDNVLQPDIYTEGLKNEFARFQGKLDKKRVPQQSWKYLRMRPSSFPSLRIAQLSAFIQKQYPFHEELLTMPCHEELIKLLKIRAGDYWNTHYQLGKESGKRIKFIGDNFARTIVINGIVPYLFFFGKMNKRDCYCDYAINLLEALPAEDNAILKNWGKFGIKCSNAFESQAILYLNKNYCQQKRCLECQFGNNMILDGQKKK